MKTGNHAGCSEAGGASWVFVRASALFLNLFANSPLSAEPWSLFVINERIVWMRNRLYETIA
jgi:hypothetical protein